MSGMETAICKLGPRLFFVASIAIALFIALDPFRLSVISNYPHFRAHLVPQPPQSQLHFPKDPKSKLQNATIRFLNEVQGPESLAFDSEGRGPYTGVADGRILRWNGPEQGWSTFGTTSPHRSEICSLQSTSQLMKHEHVCGRPLGLRFDKRTGDLYIADAYFGLLRLGPQGGLATRLVSQADGMPLRFTNDLDVADDGSVYFTDSSMIYQRRQYFLLFLSGEGSGRVMRYDPVSNKTTVLLGGLKFPNGVSLSKDESFLVISESVPGRLLKYWLKGPKSGSTEIMTILPGYPDNVRRNDKGDFWVALHCKRSLLTHLSGAYPLLRRLLSQLPVPFKQLYRLYKCPPHGLLVRCNESGELLEVLEDREGKVVKYASEAKEREGKLWVGSVLLPYVSVYDISSRD